MCAQHPLHEIVKLSVKMNKLDDRVTVCSLAICKEVVGVGMESKKVSGGGVQGCFAL